jgi:L-lactate utilization protein LutC
VQQGNKAEVELLAEDQYGGVLLEAGVGIAETGRVLLRRRQGGSNGRQLSWALKI